MWYCNTFSSEILQYLEAMLFDTVIVKTLFNMQKMFLFFCLIV